MSKDEIKDRFKKTKLGKKIYKRFKITLITFIISHIIMLISLILFVPNINSILSGKIGISIIFGILLFLSAILSFIFSIFLVYYDGKINGCIELFDLMLKVQEKKKGKDN